MKKNKTEKICLLLMWGVALSCAVASEIDYSTVQVTPAYPDGYAASFPIISGVETNWGVCDYRIDLTGGFLAPVVYDPGPGSWDVAVGRTLVDPLPSDYVHKSLMALACSSDTAVAAYFSFVIEADNLTVPPFLLDAVYGLDYDLAILNADDDLDGLANYKDPDYNPYMATVPEPESVALMVAGMVLILNRLEFYSTVTAIAASLMAGFNVWFLFVGAKNEKRIW